MDSLIGVTGRRTTIVQELSSLAEVEAIIDGKLPTGAHKFVLAAGVLHGKQALDQTPVEAYETVNVNMIAPIKICEKILSRVPNARICVVGSHSGIAGSYDHLYAASKAGLHKYVETRQTLPEQQLVAVAPIIIADSGMTMRRADYPAVLSERETVTAARVAQVIFDLLHDYPMQRNVVVPVRAC